MKRELSKSEFWMGRETMYGGCYFSDNTVCVLNEIRYMATKPVDGVEWTYHELPDAWEVCE